PPAPSDPPPPSPSPRQPTTSGDCPAGISTPTALRSWPMPSKMPAATTSTSSPTCVGRGRTSGGAGWSISCWGRTDVLYQSTPTLEGRGNMTKIWCQSANEHTQARIVSEEWFESGFSVFDFKPARGQFSDLTLKITSARLPADFFEPGTMFVVSGRLKSVLEEFNVHAEFFPLRIIYRGREYTERTFYFCNILDCVE